MLASGTALGPYRILSLVGAGGMGQVYRAHDSRLQRDVAIKVIHAEAARDPDRIQRFAQEARAAGALNHPNVCAIYDIGSHEGSPYVVMELLEGESLGEKLRAGPLPARKAFDYAAQAARGLAAAHEKGIVHRDLKPENLFVTNDGQVKLLDFGLAKLTNRQALTSSSAPTIAAAETEKGVILGTVGYMSPEQVRGEETDTRSDLFALGAILYEMLAGRRAFHGDSLVATMHAILHEEPPPLTASGVPVGAESIILRCLEKNPAERFQSARDLAFGLESVRGSDASAVLRRRARTRRWERMALYAGALILVITAAILIRPKPRPREGRAEIAVLPFLNLSAGGPHSYFASGLHDELLTQLAKVAALKVISRTSVMGYAGTTKPLKQIAAELGVGSIVEGSVQVEGQRLRVDVQLIDAATDKHLWAERYDRTLNDAFAIQSDVAQQVVAAVGARLTRAEQERITAVPTSNSQAYQYFLQAIDYYYRPGVMRQNLQSAQLLLERAVALDPKFALAHAGLSRIHGMMYWFGYDTSPAVAAMQRQEAETALRLAPREPQAHFAMAMACYFSHDYRRALHEFGTVLKAQPNNVEAWSYISAIDRRMGRWNEAVQWFEKSVRSAPRVANLWGENGAETYAFMRNYPKAIFAYDQAVKLSPEVAKYAVRRAWVYVRWQGKLDSVRTALDRLGSIGEEEFPADRAQLLLFERQPDSLLKELQGTHGYGGKILYYGWAYRMRGERPAAREAFETVLANMDALIKKSPDDPDAHTFRGLALAGLGRRDEALREARWLQESETYRDDAFFGAVVAEGRARILAQAGAPDEALDEIERLLARPAWLSVQTLRLDPRWDPIRQQPRFKALLAKYAGSARVRQSSGSSAQWPGRGGVEPERLAAVAGR